MTEISNKAVWVVRDPQPGYVQQDAQPYKTTIGRLAELIVGTGVRVWRQEDTALYDNAREAQTDADKRWARFESMQRTAKEFSSPDARRDYLKSHPNADPSNHTVKKGPGGGGGSKDRDLSKEDGFGALKGLSPSKQREVLKKVLLNMDAEKDEKKQGPSKQKDVSKEKGFEALKGLSPGAQRRVLERALKMADLRVASEEFEAQLLRATAREFEAALRRV